MIKAVLSISALPVIAQLACGGTSTGLASATLTVNNQTANATVSLDVVSNPTIVIAAGKSICKQFSSTMDTTVFTITVSTTGGPPLSQGFSWVTAIDPHLTIIAAEISGSVVLAEGPTGNC